MSSQTLFLNIEKHFEAIDLCLKNQCIMPALILIYSGIDILATLGMPKDKKQSTRQDYIKWCEQFIIPQNLLNCTATDLYAARCSIVHTYTAESGLSRDGKANEIVYAWGNREPEPFQNALDKLGLPQRVIHVETLLKAFRFATEEFLKIPLENEELLELMNKRSLKFFKNQTDESWRKIL